MSHYNQENRPKSLVVPKSGHHYDFEDISVPSNLIIVGSNGAGKSRFAASIENNLRDNSKKVLRISAQRAVSIPSETRLRALADAVKEVNEGNNYLFEQGGGVGRASRADREQNLFRVLSDFEAVIGLLFARTAKVYKDHYHQGGDKPITPIQQLAAAWTSLLPERHLVFNEDKMTIDVDHRASGAQFHTSRMSDGERTVLYLLAQCLAVEEGTVIIIDEPELHLHRSIVNALFSNLQLDRPDCLFVYVTHDLEFAAGQPNARKIWLQSYRNNSWTWTWVPANENLPERLLLEILGARKPVLFVEGEATSDDRKIYDILFPKMTVIPCGSCEQVIKAVAVIKHKPELTHMHAYGLIDRDFRSKEEIDSLKNKSVFALDVAEVENLYCTEEVIDILSSEFFSGNARASNAKSTIIDKFEAQLSRQISDSATFTIRSLLQAFERPSEQDQKAFVEQYTDHISSIDPAKVYHENERRFLAAKNAGCLRDILRVFNMKKLRNGVIRELGTQKDMYIEKTMSLLQDASSSSMRQAFCSYIPQELHQFTND